jgi:hypothetical protein
MNKVKVAVEINYFDYHTRVHCKNDVRSNMESSFKLKENGIQSRSAMERSYNSVILLKANIGSNIFLNDAFYFLKILKGKLQSISRKTNS